MLPRMLAPVGVIRTIGMSNAPARVADRNDPNNATFVLDAVEDAVVGRQCLADLARPGPLKHRPEEGLPLEALDLGGDGPGNGPNRVRLPPIQVAQGRVQFPAG